MPECTYIFELLHPRSVVVVLVPVDKPRPVHIGTRNMRTMQEQDVLIPAVPKPALLDLKNLEECRAYADSVSWTHGEGFVVTDRRSASVWLSREESEVLAQFPHFRVGYGTVKAGIEQFVQTCVACVNSAIDASNASGRPQRSVLFELSKDNRLGSIVKLVARSIDQTDGLAGHIAEAQVVQVLRCSRRPNEKRHMFWKPIRAYLLSLKLPNTNTGHGDACSYCGGPNHKKRDCPRVPKVSQ